jgi:hypothetical protein
MPPATGREVLLIDREATLGFRANEPVEPEKGGV